MWNGGGTLTADNCTFSGNSTSYEYGGAAVYLANSGDPAAVLTNCTITGNTASGTYGRSAIARYSGTVTVTNSIVAGTCHSTVTGTYSYFDPAKSGTGNLSSADGDPGVGEPADNGGPALTCALSPESVCIDAGTGVALSRDQRGYPRDSGNGADMGAFEFQTGPAGDAGPPTVPENLTAEGVADDHIRLAWDASSDNVPVSGCRIFRDSEFVAEVTDTYYDDTGLTPLTTYSYTVSACDAAGNCSEQSDPVSVALTDGTLTHVCVVTDGDDAGPGSLRQCLLDAENGSLITFSDDHIITLDSKITIGKYLTVDAEGFAVTLQADAMPGVAGHGLLTVSRDAAVTIKNMTLRHGRGTMASAAIQSDGTLTLEDCVVTENHAPLGYDYPGIANTGTLTIVRSVLSDHADGRAVIVNIGPSAVLTARDSTFRDNGIPGIRNSDGGSVSLSGCTFVNNHTSGLQPLCPDVERRRNPHRGQLHVQREQHFLRIRRCGRVSCQFGGSRGRSHELHNHREHGLRHLRQICHSEIQRNRHRDQQHRRGHLPFDGDRDIQLL